MGTKVVSQSRPRVQGTGIVYWERATRGTGPGAPKMPCGHGREAMPGRATPHVRREQVGSETASGLGGAVVRVRQRGNPCQVSQDAQPQNCAIDRAENPETEHLRAFFC